jgi:hypothetical protein
MEKNTARIAFMARRYKLLSEHPEYLTGTHGEHIEYLLRSDIGQLDRTLILHTSPVDRVCGQLVAVLCASRRMPLALLEAFEVLEPDHIVAVYWAAPPSRREGLRRNPVWAFHLDHAPADIEQSIEEIEQLAEETQQSVLKIAALTAGASKADRIITRRHERTAMSMASKFPNGSRR